MTLIDIILFLFCIAPQHIPTQHDMLPYIVFLVLILDLRFETANLKINVCERNGGRLCPKLFIFVSGSFVMFLSFRNFGLGNIIEGFNSFFLYYGFVPPSGDDLLTWRYLDLTTLTSRPYS